MISVLLLAVLTLVGFAHARAGAFTDLTLIGCNDDFNSRASNLAELLKHNPDIIFIQEGKAADYRHLRDDEGNLLLPRGLWGVHQDTSSPDRAGSVIIYRHDDSWANRFVHEAGGFTFGVRARGLLTRWTAWLRGKIGGRRVFLFSTHRPPFRARMFWRAFDLRTWARIRLALLAGRVVLGEMDSNEHGGPGRLPRGLRWLAVGRSIDGFIVSRGVEVLEGPTELPKGSSDHHPIKLVVRLWGHR
jgi:hypothetical protein